MRKSILKSIEEALDLNPDVIFIGSDLGHGVLNEARIKNPDRVLIEGISEQKVGEKNSTAGQCTATLQGH